MRPGAPASSAELKTEDEKTLYAIGLMLAKNAVGPMKLTPAEAAILERGFADMNAGRPPVVTLEQYGPKIQAFLKTRAEAAAASTAGPEKEKGKAFATRRRRSRVPSGLPPVSSSRKSPRARASGPWPPTT